MLEKALQKTLTRSRVVPIISAKVFWVINGNSSCGLVPPKSAIIRSILVRRFSLELGRRNPVTGRFRVYTRRAGER